MKAQHQKLVQVTEKCKLLAEQVEGRGVKQSEQGDLLKIREELAKRDEALAVIKKKKKIILFQAKFY
jgi:hypothetical protein